MPSQFVLPRQVKINVAGRPYAGAQAYFYQAGTSVLQTVYQDQALTTPHDQPVSADDDGYWPVIWLDSAATADYRVVINSATGSLLDDFESPRQPFSSSDIGTTLDSLKLTTAETAENAPPVNLAYARGDVRRYVLGALEQSRAWYCYGHIPTYVDATHFTLAGNLTSRYLVGQRVRTLSNAGGIADFRMLSVSFSAGITTVTIFSDTGAGTLPNPIAAVSVQVAPDETTLSNITYDLNTVTSGLTVANRNQGAVAVGRISVASIDPVTGLALAHLAMAAVPPSYVGAYLTEGPTSGQRATIYSQVTSSLDIGTSDVSRLTFAANGDPTVLKTDLTVNNGNGSLATTTLTINALTTTRLALNVNSTERGFVGATATEALFGTNSSISISLVTNGLRRLTIPAGGLGDYADDAAAAAGSVPVGSMYRTGSTLKVRVA